MIPLRDAGQSTHRPLLVELLTCGLRLMLKSQRPSDLYTNTTRPYPPKEAMVPGPVVSRSLARRKSHFGLHNFFVLHSIHPSRENFCFVAETRQRRQHPYPPMAVLRHLSHKKLSELPNFFKNHGICSGCFGTEATPRS